MGTFGYKEGLFTCFIKKANPFQAIRLIGPVLIPGFDSIKRKGIIFPLGRMLVYRRLAPQQAGTHLLLSGQERWMKSFVQRLNTVALGGN